MAGSPLWTTSADHLQILDHLSSTGSISEVDTQPWTDIIQTPSSGLLIHGHSLRISSAVAHLHRRLSNSQRTLLRSIGRSADTLTVSDLSLSLLRELSVENGSSARDLNHCLQSISNHFPGEEVFLLLDGVHILRDEDNRPWWSLIPQHLPCNVHLVLTSATDVDASVLEGFSRLRGTEPCDEDPDVLLPVLREKFDAALVDRVIAAALVLNLAWDKETLCQMAHINDDEYQLFELIFEAIDPFRDRIRGLKLEQLSVCDSHLAEVMSTLLNRLESASDVRKSIHYATDVLLAIANGFTCGEAAIRTLFRWDLWQVWAVAGSLSLLKTVINQALGTCTDSQLWILHQTVTLAGKAMDHSWSPAHLAAQMVALLKPYVDEKNDGKLFLLYKAARDFCYERNDPTLVPCVAWNHQGKPLKKQGLKLDAEDISLMTVSDDARHAVVVTTKSPDPQLWLLMANRYVTSFRGHSGKVTCLHITRDDEYLITGSADLTVIVWQLQSGKLIQRIREHIAPVLSIASANDVIISGGEDSILIGARLSSGQPVARVDHHRGPVNCVQVNQRQDVVISGSQDGSVCLWSLEDWSLLNVIQISASVNHVALSSDDIFLVIVDDNGLARLHSLTTGSQLRIWSDLPTKVRGAVVAGGDGHSLAAFAARDGSIYCHDCHSGQLFYTLQSGQSLGDRSALCARTRDPRLLFQTDEAGINVWLLRYEETRPIASQCEPVNFHVTALAMAPEGSVAATGYSNGCVTLWRSNLTKSIHWNHGASVSVVTFDVSGLYVVSAAADGTVYCWHLDKGKILPVTKLHSAAVTQAVILNEWKGQVVSCDAQGSVLQWDLHSGNILGQWSGVSKCLAVSANSKFAVGANGSNSAQMWSLEKEDEKKLEVGHSDRVLCLTVTSDAKYAITGSKDASLKMWQTDKGKLVQVMVGHSESVTCVASVLAATGSSASAAASRNLLVVSGSSDGGIITWDAVTGSELHNLAGHSGAVRCLSVTADGSVALSGSEDCTIRLWNLKTGSCFATFWLGSPVMQIAHSPDASRIWIRVENHSGAAVLDLRKTPAVIVKSEVASSRPASPVNRKAPPAKRFLKKEISLDSYGWIKRYGRPAPQTGDPRLTLQRRNSFTNMAEATGED